MTASGIFPCFPSFLCFAFPYPLSLDSLHNPVQEASQHIFIMDYPGSIQIVRQLLNSGDECHFEMLNCHNLNGFIQSAFVRSYIYPMHQNILKQWRNN